MSDKVALVTGFSRGIGQAICEKLVSEGFTVYGTYNTGKAEAKELQKRLKNVKAFQADFSERDQLVRLIEQLKDVRFDAIVNNAGIFEEEDFEDYDISMWDNTLSVNVTAPLLISLGLKDNLNKGGAIVNISSTDGFIGAFSSMAYGATKAALINLTKSLANNFADRGVRVNAVAPAWINTGMATEASYKVADITPMGRNGRPEEVADLVSYLISDKASFITGATITIDGGNTCVDFIMLLESGRKPSWVK